MTPTTPYGVFVNQPGSEHPPIGQEDEKESTATNIEPTVEKQPK